LPLASFSSRLTVVVVLRSASPVARVAISDREGTEPALNALPEKGRKAVEVVLILELIRLWN